MKYAHIIYMILLASGAGAQTIQGTVSDAMTGTPLPGSTVRLLNTELGAVADAEGKFTLAGKGNLEISFLGYEKSIVQSEETSMAIELTPSAQSLQTVEVIGRAAKDYNSDYSFSALKIAARNKDIPQSISTVSKELIADRGSVFLGDAVKIASGVVPSSHYNQYTIRGISQNEEGQILNGMRTRQYYFLQPLTTHIERVEVIKGPASATFSSVDPGGSVNIVTKKPLAKAGKSVSIGVGSFGTFRSSMDFTGPLNESKTLLYRMNAAYQDAGSFRDLINNKALLVSPSISYVPNDKTALNVELIYSDMKAKLDRGQPIFGAVAGVTDLNSTPISLNLGAPNDFFKSREMVFTGNFKQKISDRISFNATYMKQSWTEDLREHRTTNAFPVDMNNQPVTSLAAMQFVERQQFWTVDNLSSYFTFDLKTGSVGHKMLVGHDLSRWQKLKGGGQNAARGYLLNDGSVASSFVPANAANYQTIAFGDRLLPRPNVAHFDLANPVNEIRNPEKYTLNVRTARPTALTETHALYFQDQIKWKKFQMLVSLRHEWFKDITNYKSNNPLVVTKTALLPRVGLTYSANKAVNIYATYLKGFQPQSNTASLMPQTETLPGGSLFDPLVSDLKEFGLKTDLFGNRLKMNMAVYEINQKNILMNANDPENPDLLVTRGADRSRGFEWDLGGYITPNLQINASYSYIDAIIVKDNNEALTGARKQNTPKHSANIWTRYNFSTRSELNGLGIGLGAQYQSNMVPWFTRSFMLPSFLLFDAAVYYKPSKSPVEIALNVNNVFNKTHWLGAHNYLRLFPGAPRNVNLTVTYRF